ncbi:hypothetical protein BJ912DRAFT_496304 [Pholiota molesta]|nr:hypothetical protein BJ912DRAFT_496304 [Pholiota molesta]
MSKKAKRAPKRKTQQAAVFFIDQDARRRRLERELNDLLSPTPPSTSAPIPGSELDAPLGRSSHHLRREPFTRSKNTKTKRVSPKSTAAKRAHSAIEDDEDKQHESEASVTEVDADFVPHSSRSNKKRRIALATPTITFGRSLTDRAAAVLFGAIHHGGNPPSHSVPPEPTSAANSGQPSAIPAQPRAPQRQKQSTDPPGGNPPSRSAPPQPTSAANSGRPSAVISAQPRAPQQQSTDPPRIPKPLARRPEGYTYPTPTPYAESYNERFAPMEHPPYFPCADCQWNPAPGQGWYPPGPGIAALPPSAPDPYSERFGQMGHPPYCPYPSWNPAPYAESCNERFAPMRHHPPSYPYPSWHPAPGPGWYPPGAALPPPASYPPMFGPAVHRDGYWMPVYADPYRHYPPPAPNTLPYHVQDGVPRGHNAGQPGPSTWN